MGVAGGGVDFAGQSAFGQAGAQNAEALWINIELGGQADFTGVIEAFKTHGLTSAGISDISRKLELVSLFAIGSG